MSRTVVRFVAVFLAVGAVFSDTSKARAENGQVAAGIAGGLIGGALIGGALANRPVYPPPPPVYYAPAPVVVEEPACRMVRERFWDGWGYRMRRVEVCD